MDNPLEMLLPEPGQQPTTHAEPAAAPAPEPKTAPEGPAQDRAKDARGKFAGKSEPAPEPAQAAPAPAPQAPPPEPGHVPISALLDEREKRQAADRAYRELQERLAAQQPQEPPPPEEAFEQVLYAQNLRISRRFAERQYGAELTASVHDWAVKRCDADPLFNLQMRSSDDPYEAAMQAYNREQILAAVGPSDLEAFQAWKTAQAQLSATQPVPQPAPAAPLPRSLADAPGNGAVGLPHVPVGPGEAFRSAIPR
jgi:hypothetical protein